jgi:hypothetical protein
VPSLVAGFTNFSADVSFSCQKEFWDFLISKRDGLCKVPETRYNIDAFYEESRIQPRSFDLTDPEKFSVKLPDIIFEEVSMLGPN